MAKKSKSPPKPVRTILAVPGISIEEPRPNNEVLLSEVDGSLVMDGIRLRITDGTASRIWAKVYSKPCVRTPDENPFEAGALSMAGSPEGDVEVDNLLASQGKCCLTVWAIFDGQPAIRKDQRDFVGAASDAKNEVGRENQGA